MTKKICIGALLTSLATVTAIAQQQQSPFQTPAVVTHASTTATAGNSMILNLSGVTVTDEAGQPLGPIQHILLSPGGCVDLAVLSLGGQRLVPIPWRLVSGVGAVRPETIPSGQVTLAAKVDVQKLQQAPSFTINQLSQLNQQQTIQQVYNYYGVQQWQTQMPTDSQPGVNVGVGGTSSQTNILGGGLTNRVTAGTTNQITNAIPSPTGPTNTIPGRPPFETNRPGQPGITPGSPPANRPPANRPPFNRPPTNQPNSGITPSQPIPSQPTPGQP